MAGSKPGPMGKRTEERIRTNKPPEGWEAIAVTPDQVADLPFDIEFLVKPPEADEDWHPIAIMLYESLLRDPARIWMGPTDWAMSYLMCESVSREMNPQVVGVVDGGIDLETGEKVAGHVAREIVPMKGTTITAVFKWASSIGITEAGRLALRREVTFHNKPVTQKKNDTASRVSQERPTDAGGLFSVPTGESA